MKVSGIEVLQNLQSKNIYARGTEFRLIKENKITPGWDEIPFLEKNRILHTDGHSLYNLIGEAPTIDLILNYDFEIIEEDKSIEDFKTEYTCDHLDFEIINYINNLNKRLNKLEKGSN